jgi:Fibrobacter succinogenes major domain (Fib_succ_major).
MKKQLTKLALTAALGLALTFTACEEKKKQDSTTPTPTETEAAAETQEATQEVVAEKIIEVVKGFFTDTRDNKAYKTVKIGEQVWMAENLNCEAKEGSKCDDDNPANCEKYGRLYDWPTAMGGSLSNVQGICPSGWHLPSNAEWNKLMNFAGGDKAAEKLKAKSWNGVDAFGFSALSGGWWSSSEEGVYNYKYNYDGFIFYSGEQAYNEDYTENYFNYVRCIKD